MEPSKLEKQIKEKLDSREIKPSEMAWDRLDAMLNGVEKPKRKWSWIYIAASFIGFVFIGTFFFKTYETKKIDLNLPLVIEQKDPEISSEESGIIDEETSVLNSIKNTNTAKQVVAQNNKLKTPSNPLKNNNKEGLIINQSKGNNIVINSSDNKDYQSISRNKYVSAEKLLAEVYDTKFEARASDKIIEKTIKVISIDPNSLLSNVETELNQSFRESALEKLNKNYNAIKTVLANRNYEE
ncbi:hypothetical protein [Flavobacterium acetivorans]|uniref:hypothetical protein n=1 Tax=Flavobacterium acetivorans TaxID=2893883 RepID=UPI001E43104E|nr:hypothetical protein [Flavobacterium sp. F-29]UFH36743.1 hypothetical protein LNP19_06790 [Flavobacterium sp. F-29]